MMIDKGVMSVFKSAIALRPKELASRRAVASPIASIYIYTREANELNPKDLTHKETQS